MRGQVLLLIEIRPPGRGDVLQRHVVTGGVVEIGVAASHVDDHVHAIPELAR
ncbi:MAG TPA: hypothetical protein VIY28_11870 [Pseudonocardiaceae bacterium]